MFDIEGEEAIDQWFSTFLEVLIPTSSTYAFIELFLVGKIECALFLQTQNICI